MRALASGKLPGKLSAARTFYNRHRSYYWSQVCLKETYFSTKKQAEAAAAGAPSGGSEPCFTPQELIQQAPAFRSAVLALAPGHTTVFALGKGYEAVALRSRSALAYDGDIVKDIETAAVLGGVGSLPQGNTAVINIVKAANVEIRPGLGTWLTCQAAPSAPLVEPLTNALPC
jgi:hypothetical protein